MKFKKIIALTLGLALVGGLLYFANGLIGNPLSKIVAKHSVSNYIDENYGALNLEITDFNFNFKTGGYYANCQSTSSRDTVFSINVDSFGNIGYDTYESEVLERYSTFRRLDSELRHIGDAMFRENLDHNVVHSIFHLDSNSGNMQDLLIPNMELDINNPPLPLVASVTVDDPDVSYDKMAEILVDMADLCEFKNIPVDFYSIRIEFDRLDSVEDGAEARENLFLNLYNIPKEILMSDDIAKSLELLDD